MTKGDVRSIIPLKDFMAIVSSLSQWLKKACSIQQSYSGEDENDLHADCDGLFTTKSDSLHRFSTGKHVGNGFQKKGFQKKGFQKQKLGWVRIIRSECMMITDQSLDNTNQMLL